MKKRLTVLALALAMVLTMSASVFADDPAPATQYPAGESYLVKYLEASSGVTVPADKTFTFTFTAKTAGAPAISDVVLSTEDKAATASEEDENSIRISKKISDILSGVQFRAGVWEYTVKETAGTATEAVAGTNITRKYTYSKEEYTLKVVHKNDGSNSVVVEKTKDEEGQATSGNKVNPVEDPTVDPTQNPPADNTEEGTADSIPGFSFTNKLEETLAEDPATVDPTSNALAFKVTKTVTGDLGDKEFAFPFTITGSKGAGMTSTTATGYVYDAEGEKKGNAVTITLGSADGANFNLMHGETFVLTEVPAGAQFEVTENLEDCGVNNEASYTASFDGDTSTNPGTDASSATKTVKDSEGTVAACTNAFDDSSITPTGIIINNLPYVLLIVIALGGIVLFSRKRRYE